MEINWNILYESTIPCLLGTFSIVVETEHNQPEATMKTPLQALLTSLFLLGPLATAAPEWHTFNNAAGSSNFKAAMIGCDSRAATITVRMRGSRQHTTFKIALLSEEDQAYARAKGKELAAVSGFRFRFDNLYWDEKRCKSEGDCASAG